MKCELLVDLLLMFGLVIAGCSKSHIENNHASGRAEEKQAERNSHGQASTDHPRPEKLVLPNPLQAVLREEMRLIETGMGELLGHLAQGRKSAAIEVAERIQKSFVLKQELSGEDLQLLVSLLPEEFVTQDRGFHANAGKLAESVRQGDFASAVQIYGDMAQSCVSCHVRYAGNRFPTLVDR